MLKKLKTTTRVVSLILSLILIYQASPIDAIAANIADLSTQQSDNSIENEYNDVTNIYYGSHSLDVGRAGTLSVNDYSLIPYLNFDTLSIDGNICPVSISMKYNSADYRFLTEIADIELASYGDRWSTNYNSVIIELDYDDKVQLAYTTGNNTVMLFEQSDITDEELSTLPTGTTKWESVSNYDCFIYRYTDEYTENTSETGYEYIMYTENETYSFDSDGRLINIVNENNNSDIEIIYNESIFDAIEKIIDGVGREYRFTYTNGLLTKIKCYSAEGTEIIAGDNTFSAPLEISFAYTADNLTQVTFPDGKAVTYTYDLQGKLITANNIDGYKAELTYTNGTISKIAEYAMKNDEYVAGKFINISCDGNVRTFTDNTGDIQIKTFDSNGNIISIVDGDGNYLYGEPEEEEEESSETIPEEESSETIPEEESSETIPEEESSEIQIEDTSEEYYEPTCPCTDCPEWDCECVCESEDVCNCIQCKRYSDTANDVYGNITSESSFDGSKTMSSLTSYTSDGNYIASSVDTSGNTVYYIYGEDGFLDSMTSGESTVNFRYDSMGNLIELSQQNSIDGYGFTMSNQYTYTNDRVTSITHNGFSYNFTYDEWGNQLTVSVGEHQLVGYEYDYANDSRLTKINYANGQSESYTYDTDGNITAISHDNGATNTYEYEYNSDGVLTKVTDNRCGLVTTYTDTSTEIRTAENTLVYSTATNEDGTQTENILGNSLIYTYNDEYNQVTGKTVSTKAFSHSTVVTEDEIEYSISSDVDISVTTDWFGRTESKEISVESVKTNTSTEETSELNVTGEYNYTYADTENTASTKVTAHSSTFTSDSNTYSQTDYYEYDASGNITGIYRYVDNVKTYYYTYVYDEAGQLIRENILEDNKTILYYYDMGGNIFVKGEFEYTLGEITDDMSAIKGGMYTYENEDWCDQLTHYEYYDGTSGGDDNIDSDLVYDEAGNVTSFDGQTFTWTAGRQLDTAVMDDGDYIKYYYNENGLLAEAELYESDGTSKGKKQFIWDGDKLIAQNVIDNDSITFVRTLYDTDDEAIGLIFRQHDNETDTGEQIWLYRKNLQGDVTGVIDGLTGALIGSFTYDAYGMPGFHPTNDNQLSILGSALTFVMLPQIYRGYTYFLVGSEICYYLGSRFYSPRMGRFLNADKHTDTDTGVIGTNMYAYCNNNPVMNVDFSGKRSTLNTNLSVVITAFLIGVILESFIKYLNPSIEIAPNAKIKLDQNYLFSTSARYKKSKYLYNKLKIVFGDYYAWKNSSSPYNNESKVYYDHYTSYIASQIANPNGNLPSSVLINNFGLRPTILITNITAYSARKVFNQIWGTNGFDKLNADHLIVFKVTQDKKYNGIYLYSPQDKTFSKVS